MNKRFEVRAHGALHYVYDVLNAKPSGFGPFDYEADAQERCDEANRMWGESQARTEAKPAIEFRGTAVIDIPAGYPNEAALIAFLRTKGYDANVCDSARVLWNGAPVYWDAALQSKFETLLAEFDAQNDPCVIRLDSKPWGWTRDTSATRLQQRGVPEHIALSAITLAVLGGKAIVFGSDNVQITVERG